MNDIFKRNYRMFLIGGIGYGLIEILYRGYTHWTMMLTGGFCFLCLYQINIRYIKKSLLTRTFLGVSLIVTTEFIVGCIVNLWLGWQVWDYTLLPFNVFGQVCLYYSLLWFLLTIPIHWFCSSNLNRFNEKFLPNFRRFS